MCKIDRKNLKETEDLFNELRGLEHLVKKITEKREKVYPGKKIKTIENKKPCKICKEERNSERYHPESSCWFRQKSTVKTVNNSKLEIELNEKKYKKLIVPPLIRIKLRLNDTLDISAIYDSGSNVSLINAKLLKFKQRKTNFIQTGNLRTINSVEKTNGSVNLKIKIYDIEENMDILVVNNDNFKYDFVIGLDCIKKFQLIQTEGLRITQNTSTKQNKADTSNKHFADIPKFLDAQQKK